jgi:hypothetical protein
MLFTELPLEQASQTSRTKGSSALSHRSSEELGSLRHDVSARYVRQPADLALPDPSEVPSAD